VSYYPIFLFCSTFCLSSPPCMMLCPQAYVLASGYRTCHCLALQETCSPTKMIEDACAIIVQAAVCAATKILHEEESSVPSRAGRIMVRRVRRSVHEVYHCLGNSYFFNVHTTCPTNQSEGFIPNMLQKLILQDWHCAVMCQRGGKRGVKLSCHPYEMSELR
jgi:hypothetical protein